MKRLIRTLYFISLFLIVFGNEEEVEQDQTPDEDSPINLKNIEPPQ